MMSVTINDLFAEIGRLTMEKKVLEAENRELKAVLSATVRKEEGDVPSTIPSTVPGPDDDSRLG